MLKGSQIFTKYNPNFLLTELWKLTQVLKRPQIYTKYSTNLQMYIIFPVVKNGDLLVLVLLNMHFSLSSNCLAGCSGYFDGF